MQEFNRIVSENEGKKLRVMELVGNIQNIQADIKTIT